ncbi:NB-ARC domain-containing protein [Saccharothrix xinjiangensis]|uniref:NB-ARC domain-containing protein n=1 Tax=Saccharothrix xinjiangensis TaxID=204798 RepID=A0ABV9XZD1_9PSEU
MKSSGADTANHLGGTVHGPAVQAGSVDVLNIHVPGPATGVVAIPWQLPPVTRAFTDRKDDRERLSLVLVETDGADAQVAGGPVVVGLYGAAGIGKSALAVRWVLDVRERFPDGVLYVRFDASGPGQTRHPDSILVGFLLALGVAQHALPADPEHCAALFRTLTAHRTLVVLLDDVDHGRQVTPLLHGGSACLVVTTSRHPLGSLVEHGARVHHVEPLDHEHGLALFQAITGPDRARSDLLAAARLVELCHGRPLTIAAFAAAAAIRPGVPLADLVDDLNHPLDIFDRNSDTLVNHAVQAGYAGAAGRHHGACPRSGSAGRHRPCHRRPRLPLPARRRLCLVRVGQLAARRPGARAPGRHPHRRRDR